MGETMEAGNHVPRIHSFRNHAPVRRRCRTLSVKDLGLDENTGAIQQSQVVSRNVRYHNAGGKMRCTYYTVALVVWKEQ